MERRGLSAGMAFHSSQRNERSAVKDPGTGLEPGTIPLPDELTYHVLFSYVSYKYRVNQTET